jgi:Uma2 family endonuclease
MTAATHPTVKPVVPPDHNGAIPPLESGDRLTRAEFMRRYEAMPDVKAELIEGVVYVSSPVRHKKRGRPHSRLVGWLINYEAGTAGVEATDTSTILLDLDNTPQPDALLFVKPEFGGRVKINVDDYIQGAPDLVVEIAAGSASYDLHDKLNAYRRS